MNTAKPSQPTPDGAGKPWGGSAGRKPGGPLVRRWSDRLVLVAVAALVFRTWCVQGLFVPIPVASGSMADTLLGPHRWLQCEDCGYGFAFGTDHRATPSRPVCPNCGFRGAERPDWPVQPGDCVLVDKAVFLLRRPRRWEVVVIRHPERPATWVVKRVVGLPGEMVGIRGGQIFINGHIQRKTLPEQQALAIPVYDADRRPTKTHLPPRWRGPQARTGWTSSGGAFFHPAKGSEEEIDWLVYHHRVRLPGGGGVHEVPVTNQRGYNQRPSRHPRSIHPVPDVGMVCRLQRINGTGELFFRAGDGRDELILVIGIGCKTYQVLRNGHSLGPRFRGRLGWLAPGTDVVVSLVDRQFLVAVEGRPLVAIPLDGENDPPPGTARPLAIGVRSLGVEVDRLRVFRDVHYGWPVGPGAAGAEGRPIRLADDEYYLLGDNSPVSEDSRVWARGPGVPLKLVVGKPFLVSIPGRRVRLGETGFQVPDFAQIRYIR